jgi:hypothetical protein
MSRMTLALITLLLSIISAGAQVSYQALAREPLRHVGSTVMMLGKVIQAVQNGRDVVIRLNVIQSANCNWSDTMYLDYQRASESEPRILDGDVLHFVGEFRGIKSYTTVMGATMQIPHVVVRSIRRGPDVVRGPGYHGHARQCL